MITRITTGTKGFIEYLRTGKKKGSQFKRGLKDKVNVFGDIGIFGDTEKFLSENKKLNSSLKVLYFKLKFSLILL